MKIKLEELSRYAGYPVLFKWCEGVTRDCPANHWVRNKRVLKYIVEDNYLGFKDFFNNHYLCCGYGLKEEYNKAWYLELYNYDGKLSNKGKDICLRCSCRTEKRRDFSDMSIREFCPRCKI